MAGLLAGTAQAEDEIRPLDPLPMSGAVHLPMVEDLEPVAEAYWGERGISLPQPVEVFVIPDEPGVGARGETPGTRIWITELLLADKGTAARVALCDAYLHERGHNAGLPHDSGDPIMTNPPSSTPPRCVTWADQWIAVSELRHLWTFWRSNRNECKESAGPFRSRCFHELQTLRAWIRELSHHQELSTSTQSFRSLAVTEPEAARYLTLIT